MSQNQNLQDYLNKNFPEKEENQQQNTTNFYPQTQSFLPQNYEFENSNQNLYNQNINNPNLSNPNLYNQNVYNQNLYNQNLNNPNINNPFQNQQSQSLMQKINSTASNVLDFFKSKTENISIPKNPLIKVDYSQNLLPLNQNGFEEEIKNNIIEINSIKIEKGQLNDMTIISLIQNPRVINDSYFKNKYVLYDIITQQFNWSVSRRYSDFIWLKDTLQAIFPMEILPLLPKKKISNKRFEKEFIEKRAKGLQKFLDNILKNENLKSCESLTVFLSCSDRNFFEQEMKVLNTNILTAPTINQIRSMDGKLKLLNFENIQNSINYFNNINHFFKCQNEIIEGIQKNLHKFNYNLTLACIDLDEVERGFNKLSNLCEKVKLSENILNVFNQYETFFKNWRRILFNESLVFKDVLKTYLKEVKGKCEYFSTLITKQETMKDDYVSRINKLNLKKETLWQKMDMKNFDMNPLENIDTALLFRDKKYAMEKMCYKETDELNKIRGFIQYYYYQNNTNFNNLLNDFEEGYINNLKEFSNSLQTCVTDSIDVWSNLSSNITLG
jgi:hypothetical protein